jgi:hypothetical protein
MALTRTRSALKDFAREAIHAGAQDDVATARIERGVDNALKALAKRREWSFQRDHFDIVCSIPVTIDDLLTATQGSTAVHDANAGTGAFVAGQVGGFLRFNSERKMYEIASVTDDDDLTLVENYSNETPGDLALADGVISFPLYDLPVNFRKHECLFNTVDPSNELAYVDYGAMWQAHLERTGVGTPEAFSLVPKRNDPNVSQLALFPAPDLKKRYTLTYFRQPGWFSTATPATSTWVKDLGAQAIGTYDAYYVDWPDNLMDVLEAAILMSVAKEIKPESYGAYKAAFNSEVAEAAAFDKVNGTPRQLSRGNVVQHGMRARFV